jgi:2-dehydropantoate 2-reductase
MIVVVGPGALGLLLAGLLRESGREVALLDHSPARAEQLDLHGFALEGPESRPTRRIRLQVGCDPAVIERAELVIVCVKTRDDDAAARTVERGGGDATVLALGNGLGRADALSRALGRARVLIGSTAEAATRLAVDRVRHAGRGPTRIAPLVPGDRVQEAARLLSPALDVSIGVNADTIVWEKVVVNAAINGLAGLLDAPNGALLASEEASGLADRLALEAVAVARKLGVPGDFGDRFATERWRVVAAATAANLCSTVQDLRGRRKTEVHAINGALARIAREARIEAPLNDLIDRLIAAREEVDETRG